MERTILATEYEIGLFRDEDFEFDVLKRIGSDSFMDKLESNPKKKAHFRLIYKQLLRIAKCGVEWALVSNNLKLLKGGKNEIDLYELRCKPGTTRVMVYLHTDDYIKRPILLFDFEGHKAKGTMGEIRKEDMDRGYRLANEARMLIEKEGAEDNEKPQLDSK